MPLQRRTVLPGRHFGSLADYVHFIGVLQIPARHSAGTELTSGITQTAYINARVAFARPEAGRQKPNAKDGVPNRGGARIFILAGILSALVEKRLEVDKNRMLACRDQVLAVEIGGIQV